MRSIMHFYLNSFCALLEQLANPELAGKPVVVIHKSGNGEFVVSASTEAIAQGVRESMTARHAGRYCPKAICVPADWGVYRAASESVMDILSDYSPLLEPQSIDKACMDITGCLSLSRSVRAIAEEVRRRVREKLGVPVSVGVGKNKLVAEMASMSCMPGDYSEITPGAEREFLSLLPVGSLPGVGVKIEKRLLNLGVRTVGELASIPERLLVRQFGTLGNRLHKLALGIDYTRVAALYPPATISIEHMFAIDGEDVCEPELIEAYLFRMCDHLAMQLRERNEQASVITLRLEFEGLPATSRSYTLKTPISSSRGIYTGAVRVFRSEMRGTCLKSMKLLLGGLRSGGGVQLSFGGDAERRMRLDSALRNIRSRFGERAIVYGWA